MTTTPPTAARSCRVCGHDNPPFFLACHACLAPFGMKANRLAVVCARSVLRLWTAVAAVLLVGGVIFILLGGAGADLRQSPHRVWGVLGAWVAIGALLVASGRLALARLESTPAPVDAGDSQAAAGRWTAPARTSEPQQAGGHAFRLRPESSSSHAGSLRRYGLFLFAFGWNGILLAAIVAVVAAGQPVPAGAWVALALFVAIGALLFYCGARSALLGWRFRQAAVTVPKAAFAPGEAVPLRVEQSFRGRVGVEDARFRFLLRESVVHSRGNSLATRSEDHILAEVSLKERQEWGGSSFQGEAEFNVPQGAIHTMLGPHHSLRYLVEWKLVVPRWPDYVERFEVVVLPREYAQRGP